MACLALSFKLKTVHVTAVKCIYFNSLLLLIDAKALLLKNKNHKS